MTSSTSTAAPARKTSNVAPARKPSNAPPSIFALLAAKRFIRKLADRVAARRAHDDAMRAMPTFQLQPESTFNCACVRQTVHDVIMPRLEHLTRYSRDKCAILCKLLAQEVKEAVKRLDFDRYKLVCVVTLAERHAQSMHEGSRCVGDSDVDSFVVVTWQNAHIVCTVTVYGFYHN